MASISLSGGAGAATFDLTLIPRPSGYFPAVELGSDQTASGYVVPALVGTRIRALLRSDTYAELSRTFPHITTTTGEAGGR